MENIEIKAKYPDLELGKRLAEEIGARFQGMLHQIDTYFSVRQGRLKLREINSEESQLIYYERADKSGLRTSIYHIYPVQEVTLLRSLLGAALGISTVVEKKRELYVFDEVRIHLDRVVGLGSFLEFEGRVIDGRARPEVQKKVERLLTHFGIPATNLIAGSYADLIVS
ncbi:MAG: class IV adenylate cyclase [bacterium]